MLLVLLVFVRPMAISEIETYIDVHIAEGTIGGKLTLTIIICVKDGAHSCIIFCVIPHNSKTPNTINVETIE